jgi:hypothetical protein
MPFLAAIPVGYAMAAMAAGTAVTAYGQIQAGESQKKWSDYNAAVQRNVATNVAYQGSKEAESRRMAGQELIARQHVLYAKSGFKTAEGTPADLMLGTAAQIEDEANAILQKGEFGWERGMGEAGMTEASGKTAEQAGYWSGGSTLITGLANVGLTKSKFDLLSKK